ncbi:hypothetical protein [Nonomuraea jiangxiensis]|uniref:Uncharacterized protein n=1 Tax=Nonomuraea jiangxiensis TaxID=633440 RepID=A0A1G9SS00_9ACTN|nr:hypothetical protein [Nonomuraea jiangxiensis]SDM38239.1 hypothetical protein SAMN05421869_14246 [Nonomuraea jiangxiensis]
MRLDLSRKIAAFCRETEGGTLQELTALEGREDLFLHVRDELAAGRMPHSLEADLDTLNGLAERRLGKGFYPSTSRAAPLPGHEEATGAQYWSCPRGRCSGRGRVRPGQAPPFCALGSADLIAEPIPP